jgi:hypothetical protein
MFKVGKHKGGEFFRQLEKQAPQLSLHCKFRKKPAAQAVTRSTKLSLGQIIFIHQAHTVCSLPPSSQMKVQW